jgi:hypothetical protein
MVIRDFLNRLAIFGNDVAGHASTASTGRPTGAGRSVVETLKRGALVVTATGALLSTTACVTAGNDRLYPTNRTNAEVTAGQQQSQAISGVAGGILGGAAGAILSGDPLAIIGGAAVGAGIGLYSGSGAVTDNDRRAVQRLVQQAYDPGARFGQQFTSDDPRSGNRAVAIVLGDGLTRGNGENGDIPANGVCRLVRTGVITGGGTIAGAELGCLRSNGSLVTIKRFDKEPALDEVFSAYWERERSWLADRARREAARSGAVDPNGTPEPNRGQYGFRTTNATQGPAAPSGNRPDRRRDQILEQRSGGGIDRDLVSPGGGGLVR